MSQKILFAILALALLDFAAPSSVGSPALPKPKRKLNKHEIQMLKDLKQDGNERRIFGIKYFGSGQQFKKPQCYFDRFTASCCIQLKYRSENSTGKLEFNFHKACVETGLVPTELKVFVRAYYDTKPLNGTNGTTNEIFSQKKHLGLLCWNLPPPIDALEMCIWLYHVNVTVKPSPKVDFCLALLLTNSVRMQFDCMKWEDGVFDLHRNVSIPEPGFLTVHVGKHGIKFQIKSDQLLQKAKDALKKLWDSTIGLFTKAPKHTKFLTKPADNRDIKPGSGNSTLDSEEI